MVKYVRFGEIPEFKKRFFLKQLLKNCYFDNAVETGTYFARTSLLLSRYITKVYTIEISHKIYNYISHKYQHKKIKFMHGASEKIFKDILLKIEGATIFYLDSHASGGVSEQGTNTTSLGQELSDIKNFKFIDVSLIIIDDAKSVNGTNGYPKMSDIKNLAEMSSLRIFKTNINSIILCGKELKINSKKILNKLQPIN